VSKLRELFECRLCFGNFFDKQLALTPTPPANELYLSRNDALKCEVFPLTLVMCSDCRHLQLKYVVEPKRLFSNYVYKSGTSRIFREHFAALAFSMKELISPSSLIVEIGSNDGTLLSELSQNGFISVGLEPSHVLVKSAEALGQVSIEDYLNNESVREIKEKYGSASAVIANNVFAHIEDMNSAIDCISELLSEAGIFVFEVAHLLQMVEKSLFDTIYHEHMSYHSVAALIPFLSNHNFEIFKIEEIPMHGGSIRVFARKSTKDSSMSSTSDYLKRELASGINSVGVIEKISNQIEVLRFEIMKELKSIDDRYFVFGYGAPAKVVTFLSEMGLKNLGIQAVVDDNLDKQGKFLPGTGIPIISSSEIQLMIAGSGKSAVCLVFPWNLGDEILAKLRDFMPSNSCAYSFFPTIKKVEF
jgi:SAM-dependent methyltransferase